MTAESTATPLTGGVALLERAVGYTLGSLLLVTTDKLTRPTPCRAWDLAALLDHMNDSLLALHEAGMLGHVEFGPDEEADDPAYPVAALRRRACRLLGDWSRMERSGGREVAVADRPLSASLVAAAGAVEITVHGWDVAQACGRTHPIPVPLGKELCELVPLFISDADRGERFAAPVDVSSQSSAADRLVAFLGRTP